MVRFTTAFASPILCSREMDQVSNSSKTFTNMSIKRRPAAREVVAVYSVEEVAMELVVKMSPSHPLGPVAVECGKRVGVSSSQWRHWMLQLTMYLTKQVCTQSVFPNLRGIPPRGKCNFLRGNWKLPSPVLIRAPRLLNFQFF